MPLLIRKRRVAHYHHSREKVQSKIEIVGKNVSLYVFLKACIAYSDETVISFFVDQKNDLILNRLFSRIEKLRALSSSSCVSPLRLAKKLVAALWIPSRWRMTVFKYGMLALVGVFEVWHHQRTLQVYEGLHRKISK